MRRWLYIAAFITGGLLMVGIAYLLLRSSGLLYELTPNSDNKWIEYDT